MYIATVKAIVLKIGLWIGANMFSRLERWIYSDDNLKNDIIVHARAIIYYDAAGIPTLSTYLDIQNRTPYAQIEIQPGTFDIDGVFKLLFNNFHIIYRKSEMEAIRFETILTNEQKDRLTKIRDIQTANKGTGQLRGNINLVFQCNKRKIYIGKTFDAMKLEGI